MAPIKEDGEEEAEQSDLAPLEFQSVNRRICVVDAGDAQADVSACLLEEPTRLAPFGVS